MAISIEQIITDINQFILSGGRRTTASNVRALLTEVTNSYPNLINGGNSFQSLIGYTSELTLTDRKNFVHKGYVDDLIGADLTAYFKKDGSIAATGNFDLGGFNIQNVNLVKVKDGGGLYNTSNNASVIIGALGDITVSGHNFSGTASGDITFGGSYIEFAGTSGWYGTAGPSYLRGLSYDATGVKIQNDQTTTIYGNGSTTALNLNTRFAVTSTGGMAVSSANNGFYATLKTDNVVSNQTYQFPANGGTFEVSYYKGIANGYAGLDASGKVPTSQLPAGIVGAMQYQGTWNPATNTPALASGVGTTGYFYKVSVTSNATIVDGNGNWHVGDWIVFNGTTWDKIDNYEAVTTVFGRVGDITLLASDITGALTYTPANAATTFINGGNSFAGNATIGTNDNYTLAFKTNGITALTFDTTQRALFAASILMNDGLGNKTALSTTTNQLVVGSGFNGISIQNGASNQIAWSSNQLTFQTSGGSAISITLVSGNITMTTGGIVISRSSGSAGAINFSSTGTINATINNSSAFSSTNIINSTTTGYFACFDAVPSFTANSGPVYAFKASINSGTNLYNFYNDGTAPNYFAGKIQIANNLQFKGGSRAITDDNGNTLIGFSATVASAVNYIQISNTATTGFPSIAAVGTDSNIGLLISSKGRIVSGSGISISGNTTNSTQNSVLTLNNSLDAAGDSTFSHYNATAGNTSNRSVIRLIQNNASSAASCNTYLWGKSIAITALSESTQFGIDVSVGGVRTNIFTADGTSAIFSKPVKIPSFTVATVPSASTLGAGSIIYVSNESGGATIAFSDGTNWRRVTDNAIIS